MPHNHALLGLLTALDRFAEATGAASQDRKRVALAGQAERLIAKVFKAQGRAFVRALRTAGAPASATNAAKVDYWLAAWDHVAKALRKSMTAALEAGIRQSFDMGQSTVVDQVRAATATLRARTARESTTPPTGEIQGGFRAKDPRAQAYINQHAAALVAGIDDTTRKRLAKMLQAGLERGDSITKLTNAIADQFTEFSQERAKLIATTEINQAFAAGQLAAAAEMHARGLDFEKHWRSRRDGRVEAECMANDEQGWILVDRPFSSGHDRPLAHPRCRCIMLTRMAAETGGPVQPAAAPAPAPTGAPTATGGGAGGNIPRPPVASGGSLPDGPEEHNQRVQRIVADLDALGHSVRGYGQHGAASFGDQWARHLPMLPSEFIQDLFAGFGGNFRLQHATFQDGVFAFEAVRREGIREVLKSQHVFDFNVPEDRFLLMRVPPQFRRQNHSTVYLRNLRGILDRTAIRTIRIEAGEENGAAAWPRFGFRPDPDEYDQIKTYVRGRLDIAPYQLLAETREAIDAVLARDDADWLLDLTSIENGPGGPRVAEWLLNRALWRGSLDLDNPEQMDVFDAQVTGSQIGGADGAN